MHIFLESQVGIAAIQSLQGLPTLST